MKPSRPQVSNVISMADHIEKHQHHSQWVRLAAETDNLSILYSNQHSSSQKYYSMKILCWALSDKGEVSAVVPWMNKVTSCLELNDAYYGHWQGYYNPNTQELFDDAPNHKVLELNSALEYFGGIDGNPETVIQEIPDTIGTHAMLNNSTNSQLTLTDVLSWQLLGDGHLEAMIIDEELVNETPILPGADCLYPASENPDFKYFFPHKNELSQWHVDAI